MMRRRWLSGGRRRHHEFENVPADVLRGLGERVPVAPSGNAVAIAQDRIVEEFLQKGGVAVAPYAVIRTAEVGSGAGAQRVISAILKQRVGLLTVKDKFRSKQRMIWRRRERS